MEAAVQAGLEHTYEAVGVFEHAFTLDYGLKRADYTEAFFKNINREAVENRLA